ncbi:carbonic anhydrase 7-like [Euwallacea similis]|uniref:carbonic anhydrase 7-like n=1 Tax=Euwallacea similis TaxID=1736056 RepID=UPI00344D4917
MDFTSFLLDYVGVYHYLVMAGCVMGAFYLHEFLNSSARGKNDSKKLISYGYETHNGPSMWKNVFHEARGQRQSPINLITACSVRRPFELNPLKFSTEFHQFPCEMTVHNNGVNAVLYAKWKSPTQPNITGGPLEDDVYNFLNVRFRWGPIDNEGSEHMVDSQQFSVEMQMAFVKDSDNSNSRELLDIARAKDLLMLSYFFMVTPTDNPYLEPLIEALKVLKYPMSCANICPFPLKLLAPVFPKNYFFYEGSLTFPPCTEGVKWIVQPEPLLISSRQVSQFRKLKALNCVPIISNLRPVQMLNGREVLYYD